MMQIGQGEGDAKMLCPKYGDKYRDNAMRARDTGP